MSGARLSVDVRIDRPRFAVSVAFDVEPGECVALLGPNGSGKSTVLGGIAGLTALAGGRVSVDDRCLERVDLGHAGRAPRRLPPDKRNIALLDQRARLFPHLSIEHNLAFGPRSHGVGRAQTRRTVAAWLERIGLADRARAKPHELSGGQQQRVAIARAFAAAPQVILLDEPFAALDAESAPFVRRILAEELERTGVTAVFVTHEMSDAWQWADRCLVMNAGRIVEDGTPADLTLRPRRPFTAALAGFSVVSGVVRDGALDIGTNILSGTLDDDLTDGDAAIGIVAPHDVAAEPADRDSGVELSAVSVQAGVVRLDTAAGLSAELRMTEAAVPGGGLPRAGQRYLLTPHGMRIVGV